MDFDLLCCLNPIERGVMQVTANAFATLPGFAIPCEVWRGLWFACPSSTSPRQEAFISLYSMLEISVPSGVGGDVLCFFVPGDPILWAELLVWYIGGGGGCPAGCPHTFYP